MSQQYLEARSTSQSFVVLQACTKNLPVQDRATKFSHSFSSAASSQKDWRKEFQARVRAAKFAQSGPSTTCLPQSYDEAVASTTLYYIACKRYLSARVRATFATKLAQIIF